tara:strand:+ start:3293 stop:3679 length:387 start_codon:yes stop_codon:yes gene_type:complete
MDESEAHKTKHQAVSALIKSLDLKSYQAKQATGVAVENLLLFDRKQNDYGPYNICGNPHPQLGVAFRAGDKVNRLLNLFIKSSCDKPNCESVEDSWSDLANYGLIGTLLARDLWLEKPQRPTPDNPQE